MHTFPRRPSDRFISCNTLNTSSPSMASWSSLLLNDTRPPTAEPIIYTSHVNRPFFKKTNNILTLKQSGVHKKILLDYLLVLKYQFLLWPCLTAFPGSAGRHCRIIGPKVDMFFHTHNELSQTTKRSKSNLKGHKRSIDLFQSFSHWHNCLFTWSNCWFTIPTSSRGSSKPSLKNNQYLLAYCMNLFDNFSALFCEQKNMKKIFEVEKAAFAVWRNPIYNLKFLHLPDDGSNGLQPWGYVCLSHLWRVGLEKMGLCSFNIGNTRYHSLPQAQKVMYWVRCKLPHVERFNGKFGHKLNRLWIMVHSDQLSQLVVGLETSKQPKTKTRVKNCQFVQPTTTKWLPAKFVVIVGICEASWVLKDFPDSSDQLV